jgi:large subunit ribosomal protein L21
MYAVIRTGGKQYKVQAGDIIKVESLDKKQGDEFEMKDVLFVSGQTAHVGEPNVAGAKVTVMVTKQDRDKKIRVFKKKRRQGYRKTIGHRQDYTELFVKAITSPDGETSSAELRKAEKTAQVAKESKKAAVKKSAAPKKKAAAKKKVSKKSATKKASSKKKTKKKA